MNGVSGAAVAARVVRGVRILRDGVEGASPFPAPRLGVRAMRLRVLGVGVFKGSWAIWSFLGVLFGVVFGGAESSKRWARSSASAVGGGQFSLSGFS